MFVCMHVHAGVDVCVLCMGTVCTFHLHIPAFVHVQIHVHTRTYVHAQRT